MRHTDSLIINGLEYQRLQDSGFLKRRSYQCSSIKIDRHIMYKLVGNWSEAAWEQVTRIIEGR